jgi:hypothetical protein
MPTSHPPQPLSRKTISGNAAAAVAVGRRPAARRRWQSGAAVVTGRAMDEFDDHLTDLHGGCFDCACTWRWIRSLRKRYYASVCTDCGRTAYYYPLHADVVEQRSLVA